MWLLITIRQLRIRISEHVYAISIGDISTTLGQNAAKFHEFQQFDCHFSVLEKIPQNVSGGDWNNVNLKQETWWIHHLRASVWPSLKDIFSFRPFLT